MRRKRDPELTLPQSSAQCSQQRTRPTDNGALKCLARGQETLKVSFGEYLLYITPRVEETTHADFSLSPAFRTQGLQVD